MVLRELLVISDRLEIPVSRVRGDNKVTRVGQVTRAALDRKETKDLPEPSDNPVSLESQGVKAVVV